MPSRIARLTLVLGALLALGVESAAAEAPQMNTPASISGSAVVGGQLTAHNGTWLYDNGTSCGSECVMSYQWERCSAGGTSCSAIAGASTRFYTVTGDDAGSRLRVMEQMSIYDCGAHNTQTGQIECRWDNRTAPSGQTDVVGGAAAPSGPSQPSAPAVPSGPAPQAPLAPTPTAAPTVSGLAMVDETLTATTGTWSGSPSLKLEWFRCDAAGENCAGMGVTANAYRVIAFDVGKTIRVKVTGHNLVAAREALSDPTPVVSELKPTEAKPALEASKVTAPHKLVIADLSAAPTRLTRKRAVTVRLTVTDTRGFKISGALVTAVVLPRIAFAPPAEATSAEDGSVSLTFVPGRKLNLRKVKSVTLVVTARRPGDRGTSPRASIVRVKLAVGATKKTAKR